MPGKNPHRFILLAFLLVAGMVVSPVCAYYAQQDIVDVQHAANITKQIYSDVTSAAYSTNGTAIYGVNINVPIGGYANFTITYDGSATMQGSIEYLSVFPGYSYRAVHLDSVTEGENFVDVIPPFTGGFVVSYASNVSDSDSTVLSHGFMVHNPAFVGQNIRAYVPISGSVAANLIHSITVTSNVPMTVVVLSAPADIIVKETGMQSAGFLEEIAKIMAFVMGIFGTVLAFATFIYGIIDFFFVRNLFLTIALYFSVSMAYAATTSRNIFDFYKKFFRLQRSFLGFLMDLWNYLIQIISSFRGIFRL